MELVRMLSGMLLVALLMCSGNLCISASKRDGQIPYSSTTVTLLIEVLKLAVMTTTVVATDTRPPARFVPLEAFYYAVPSFLYAIDNNLNYVILRFMDAATLSVLWNLKIVVTAVLFRFVLKHPLSELQKIAIVLLLVGVLTSQSNHLRQMESAMSDGSSSGVETEEQAAAERSAKDLAMGLLLVLVGVVLSSCASVFTEWAFKRKSSCHFFWQNMQMYVFGIIFNAAGVLIVESDEIAEEGFFHGYNNWTLAVIAVNSIGGIGMGFILKYLDNIACVYSHSMAMMLTMLFSMIFFSFSPSLEFGCGLTVLIISMYIYHHPLAHSPTPATSGALKTRRSSGTCHSDNDGEASKRSSITERNKSKRLMTSKQQLSDGNDDDTDTESTVSSSSSSSSHGSSLKAPRSVQGLQLSKTQYAMLPGESDDLESARANAKLEAPLNSSTSRTK